MWVWNSKEPWRCKDDRGDNAGAQQKRDEATFGKNDGGGRVPLRKVLNDVSE